MPFDLEQQLARFAEALDRDAPTISSGEMVGRGAVAVDVEVLERPVWDRATDADGVPLVDTPLSHDEIGEREPIELAPSPAVRRPAWPRMALKVALAAAAVALLVVTLTSIERGGDDSVPADDFPALTTTFVSPRNGFSVKYADRGEGTVTPAKQLLGFSPQVDDGFDVVETGSAAVFKGTSTDWSDLRATIDADSTDEQVDRYLSDVLPDGCGVPRSQQAEITIDGQPGRLAECPNHIEATVVAGDRLYVFALSHDRGDARAVFDAFAATIELTPGTAIGFPAMTTTFVSPTYGYSFKYHDRGGLAPATELWDPANQPIDDRNLDERFDAVETGLLAYFEAASTPVPDGVPVDAWVDEQVTATAAGGCGVPRNRQAPITIDGQSGRIVKCGHSEATVVAGGRLYLFTGPDDDRGWFEAWVATIDLTPETATAP